MQKQEIELVGTKQIIPVMVKPIDITSSNQISTKLGYNSLDKSDYNTTDFMQQKASDTDNDIANTMMQQALVQWQLQH